MAQTPVEPVRSYQSYTTDDEAYLSETHRAQLRELVDFARQDPAAFVLSTPPCWSPGADVRVVDAFERVHAALLTEARIALPGRFTLFGNRWSSTASQPGTATTQGDPVILTWSFVDDGTPLEHNCFGATAGASNLIAFLNTVTGENVTNRAQFTTTEWYAFFDEAFAYWGNTTGIAFVYEPNDDGSAALPGGSNPGQVGVRADIRITGRTIDGSAQPGSFSVLGCAFSPLSGDIVLDTDDDFFTDNYNQATNQASDALANTLTHEIGHALGFDHICPSNQSKLMEPAVTNNFRGAQIDDIRGGQRRYGDPLEVSGGNDQPMGPTVAIIPLPVGTVGLANGLSIDADTDVDFYAFSISAPQAVTATLTPIDPVYDQGSPDNNGGCTGIAGAPFDASAVADLRLTLFENDGTTQLAQAATTPAGQAEVIDMPNLPAGTYRLRVDQQVTLDTLQRYQLAVTTSAALPVEWLYFEAAHTPQQTHALHWATAREVDNAYFVVERAGTDRRFLPLDRVAAHPEGQNGQAYTYLDATPLAGDNYYRLRQVDLDGSISYGEVRHLRHRPAGQIPPIFPNPVHDVLTVDLTGLEGRVTVTTYDPAGRPVGREYTGEAGEPHQQAVDALGAGVYFTRVQSGTGTHVLRWVKSD